MASRVLLYIGAGIIIAWGIAHIAPTKSVVKGFGDLSSDNRLIITMEWVAEGLALVFIGALVLALAIRYGTADAAAMTVYKLSAGMLFVMAAWTLLTGARSSVIPIKICPVVKCTVAVMFIVATIIA